MLPKPEHAGFEYDRSVLDDAVKVPIEFDFNNSALAVLGAASLQSASRMDGRSVLAKI